MKINVWQAETLARAMRHQDDAFKNGDEDLKSAYAEVDLVRAGDEEQIVTVRWENGGYKAIWHDGNDCTDEYNPETHPHVRIGKCPFCLHFGDDCVGERA